MILRIGIKSISLVIVVLTILFISPQQKAIAATFSMTVCPHGMGNCGDNANPGSKGNQSPAHTTRQVTIIIRDQNNVQKSTGQGNLTYNTSGGNFQGTADISGLANGVYLVFVHMDGFLTKQVPGFFTITGATLIIPSISLVAGDVNNDNHLDILDYNILISCFGSKQTTSSCTSIPSTQTSGADIDDTGIVDGVDYNLFLRELSVQSGDGGNPNPTPQPTGTNPSTQPTTPQPTGNTSPTPTNNPNAPSHFNTLPVGATLPSEAQCAAWVKKTPENRPENTAANKINEYAKGVRTSGTEVGEDAPELESKITGNFTGTTDEILQWAACKWGFDEDNVRAEAVQESQWLQSCLGDSQGDQTQPETNGNSSVGIMQVKGANIPPTFPGTWPMAYESTSWNVDYTLAIRRTCFEGKETWLGNGYSGGDEWGCIGRWFSGDWMSSGAQDYINQVKDHLNNKDWENVLGSGC